MNGKRLSLAPTLCGVTHSSGESVPATPLGGLVPLERADKKLLNFGFEIPYKIGDPES